MSTVQVRSSLPFFYYDIRFGRWLNLKAIILLWLYGQAVRSPNPICIQARRLLETKLQVGLVTARRVRIIVKSILDELLELWLYGQAVKTPASHAGFPGSNPGRVTNQKAIDFS